MLLGRGETGDPQGHPPSSHGKGSRSQTRRERLGRVAGAWQTPAHPPGASPAARAQTRPTPTPLNTARHTGQRGPRQAVTPPGSFPGLGTPNCCHSPDPERAALPVAMPPPALRPGNWGLHAWGTPAQATVTAVLQGQCRRGQHGLHRRRGAAAKSPCCCHNPSDPRPRSHGYPPGVRTTQPRPCHLPSYQVRVPESDVALGHHLAVEPGLWQRLLAVLRPGGAAGQQIGFVDRLWARRGSGQGRGLHLLLHRQGPPWTKRGRAPRGSCSALEHGRSGAGERKGLSP